MHCVVVEGSPKHWPGPARLAPRGPLDGFPEHHPGLRIKLQPGIEDPAGLIPKPSDQPGVPAPHQVRDLAFGEPLAVDLTPHDEIAAVPVAVAAEPPATLDDAAPAALGTSQPDRSDASPIALDAVPGPGLAGGGPKVCRRRDTEVETHTALVI